MLQKVRMYVWGTNSYVSQQLLSTHEIEPDVTKLVRTALQARRGCLGWCQAWQGSAGVSLVLSPTVRRKEPLH